MLRGYWPEILLLGEKGLSIVVITAMARTGEEWVL
jgi:hypothetical protein